jgi:hypothetical protein
MTERGLRGGVWDSEGKMGGCVEWFVGWLIGYGIRYKYMS